MAITLLDAPVIADTIQHRHQTRTKWRPVVQTVHAHPGKWVAVATIDAGRAHPFNRHMFTVHQVEGSVSSNGDGTATVWLRSTRCPAPACPLRPPARRRYPQVCGLTEKQAA